jgi:hypothetical protein
MARNEVSALRSKAAEYKASIIASKAFPVGTSKKIRYVPAYINGHSSTSTAGFLKFSLSNQPLTPKRRSSDTFSKWNGYSIIKK